MNFLIGIFHFLNFNNSILMICLISFAIIALLIFLFIFVRKIIFIKKFTKSKKNFKRNKIKIQLKRNNEKK